MNKPFTAAEKAKAARDEVAMRRKCYPKWSNVATVEQLPAAKRRQIELMEAIAADYDVLAEQEKGAAWAIAPAQPVQGQLFGAACPVCTQPRNQCLCPPITLQQAADTARNTPSSRTFFAGGEEPPF